MINSAEFEKKLRERIGGMQAGFASGRKDLEQKLKAATPPTPSDGELAQNLSAIEDRTQSDLNALAEDRNGKVTKIVRDFGL